MGKVTLPKVLTLRLDDAMLASLRNKAKEGGDTLSDVARGMLARGKYVPSDALRDTLRELNRIGVNLNQLARYANTTGNIQDIQATLAAIREAAAEVRNCLR